ncbi:unnamed protein product [Prunus armeniaca]
MRLAEYIEAMSGVKTKRIHKYKKQLLNILALSIDMTVSRNTKLALTKDGTCTRSRCFVLRGSAPRKDPTRLSALLPPSRPATA